MGAHRRRFGQTGSVVQRSFPLAPHQSWCLSWFAPFSQPNQIAKSGSTGARPVPPIHVNGLVIAE